MGRYEDMKKKLGEKYAVLLGELGLTEEDIKKKAYRGIGTGVGKWKKSGFHISWGLRVFMVFLIVYQAFFPFVVIQASWTIGIILAIILGLLVILALFAPALLGSAAATAGTQIIQFIVAIVLIFMILLTAQMFNCGKTSCFYLLSAKLGTFVATCIFLGLIIGGIIFVSLPLDGGSFVIGIIIFGVLAFFLIPYVSNPSSYFQACSKIPFIVGSALCQPKEVWVEPLKTVKVPVTGGITVDFGTEETNYQPSQTLYAGEPYEFAFTLTNKYEEPIKLIELKPSMSSSYGSKLEFFQPFELKVDSLKPKEFYQDSVLMDPEEMYIAETDRCPYTKQQISRYENIEAGEVVCAHDKPCEGEKVGCVKTGTLECDCADWTKATCSKSTLKAQIELKHTGFFIGNATLYYSTKMASAATGTELTQGPLSVIIEFQPNPYISTIHGYREDVSMYVTFKNHGGYIEITEFKVEPQNIPVHTVDKENEMELIEEVGTQIISCRDIKEIIPYGLPTGAEVSGKLCTLTPPSLKTTIKDLKTNEVVEVNNVTYDRISYYCNKENVEASEKNGSTYWSSNWDKIYGAVKSSGVCDILKGKEGTTKDKTKIQSSLAHTDVIVDFSYVRDYNSTSRAITPYTRTEECMKLAESIASPTTTTTTTTPATSPCDQACRDRGLGSGNCRRNTCLSGQTDIGVNGCSIDFRCCCSGTTTTTS